MSKTTLPSAIPEGGTDRPSGRNEQVAFLGVHTQFENLGDALIVRELISKLSERLPTILDTSSCPPDFLAALELGSQANVTQLRSFGRLRFLAQLLTSLGRGKRCYLFLVPGGRGGEISAMSYLKASLSTRVLQVLSRFGARVCHLGISYDMLGPRQSRVVRSRSRLLHAHYVRDRYSLQHLKKAGARVDGVMPDLAVALFNNGNLAGQRAEDIAFSFRVDKHPGRADEVIAFVQRICMAYADGREFRFISQVRRDDAFMQRLAEHVRCTTGASVRLALCTDSIRECQDLYAGCGWIVSNRLHALLLAMSMGASPLAVADAQRDVKIVGVLESIGFGSHIVALGDSPVLPEPLSEQRTRELLRHSAELDPVFDEVLSASRSAAGVRA
jgi:polysaccharide pyruvyl transferase WcaK-like protein